MKKNGIPSKSAAAALACASCDKCGKLWMQASVMLREAIAKHDSSMIALMFLPLLPICLQYFAVNVHQKSAAKGSIMLPCLQLCITGGMSNLL